MFTLTSLKCMLLKKFVYTVLSALAHIECSKTASLN